jgi:putative phage-type endonuclease
METIGQAKRVADRTQMSYVQWLEYRNKGIGGSDAAAILGVNPWTSPLALYCEKLSLTPPKVEAERMEWGRILEGPIATKYTEKTGRKLGVEPFILQHPHLPFVLANIDRLIVKDNDKGPGVLEIKTTSAYLADAWKEDVPIVPQIQLQHYLAVTGFTWGSIVVLIGGQKLEYYDFDRNDDFIRVLLEKEAEFWERVQKKEPPPVDALSSTSKALKILYPKDSGETIMMPAEAEEWAEALQKAKDDKKETEGIITGLENKIKATLGEATWGMLPSGEKFQWKWQIRKAYEVAASESRVLRKLKKGGK